MRIFLQALNVVILFLGVSLGAFVLAQTAVTIAIFTRANADGQIGPQFLLGFSDVVLQRFLLDLRINAAVALGAGCFVSVIRHQRHH